MAQFNIIPRIQTLGKTEDINEVVGYIGNLANIVAQMSKEIEFIVNGNIGKENIKANSIDASALTVDELSKISQKLGIMLEGTLYKVKIATRQSGYPRIIWSDTSDIVEIEYSANKKIVLDAVGSPTSQFPSVKFVTDLDETKVIYKGAAEGIEVDSLVKVNKLKVETAEDIIIGDTTLADLLNL